MTDFISSLPSRLQQHLFRVDPSLIECILSWPSRCNLFHLVMLPVLDWMYLRLNLPSAIEFMLHWFSRCNWFYLVLLTLLDWMYLELTLPSAIEFILRWPSPWLVLISRLFRGPNLNIHRDWYDLASKIAPMNVLYSTVLGTKSKQPFRNQIESAALHSHLQSHTSCNPSILYQLSDSSQYLCPSAVIIRHDTAILTALVVHQKFPKDQK